MSLRRRQDRATHGDRVAVVHAINSKARKSNPRGTPGSVMPHLCLFAAMERWRLPESNTCFKLRERGEILAHAAPKAAGW